ncbi:hypothetical protein [Nocardia cyriacigeorgica]|uniref:hypothetical protein n=1 Tax=Nocardia cyriacigeorgica TaxID=135487 RepID=UPI00189605E9|nr:hypothetical protein [Nocardia cyriacigeorgica]MBF6439274.1 hypothetical protein [Nocardia cyriacigeorgica]
MGTKRSNKNSRRQARRRKEQDKGRPKPPEATDEWREPSFHTQYATIEMGPLKIAAKVTGVRRGAAHGRTSLQVLRLEDTIHPVDLKFDVPLINVAVNKIRFRRHWEKLTYLFDLPDPANFPSMYAHLTETDRAMMDRFVATCRNLAKYAVFNELGGGLSIKSANGEHWTVTADLPSHEQFSGVAATFRQLHNAEEEASFSKIEGRIQAALNRLDEDARQGPRSVVSRWREARAAIMKKTVPTLVCERIGETTGKMPPVCSLEGVVPDELIRQFNYGDMLHWGKYRDKLADLTEDENSEKFFQYAVLNSIISLGHLYFGFSILLESVLGYARVVTGADVSARQ